MKTSGRRYPRMTVSIPCRVEWENESVPGEIVNLSLEGAGIKLRQSIPDLVNSRILVEVEIEDLPVVLNARVIRNDESPIERGFLGIEFQEMTPERRSRLVYLLRRSRDL